jgi:hypothetical protein
MVLVSRRAVLGGGAATAALLVAPLGWLQSALAATPIPGRDAFTGCVGATFRVSGNGLAVEAVLSEVSGLSPTTQAIDQNRFSLVFTLGGPLPQGIYTFRQKKLGSVDLFATPVDRGVKARYFQALVNR